MLFNHDFPHEYPSLTERQVQVLDCLGDHMTTKEIARVLGISPSMVDQHLRAISHKFGGVPRRELARLHAERGLLVRPTAMLSPSSPPEPDQSKSPQPGARRLVWPGHFVTGFFTGFLLGILIVFTTIASSMVVMGIR